MAWNWKMVPAELGERLQTDKQREIFALLITGMSQPEIAKRMGMSAKQKVNEVGARIKRQLQAIGYDQESGATAVVPSSDVLKGRSTMFRIGENGEQLPVIYWNKAASKAETQAEAIRSAIEAASSIKPFKPVKGPKYAMKDLCTVYTLTDYHLGMYSWADETGADWDMDIARNVMLNAVSDMMQGSPDSEVAIFAQLGDLLHWDGLLALTPTAKNVLDADTRFPLLVQTAIEVCMQAVEMMLHKHPQVHVLMAEGNHDMASSVWLRAVMAVAFKDNPRVTVDVSPFPFYHFVWGKTFLGWHHGHLQKMEKLPTLFSTDPKFRADFGQCVYTYIHTGHYHTPKLIDVGGVTVEQHPTLSARDAHAARGFLFSHRETQAITYHKEQGETRRCKVKPVFSKEAA